jgi:hypothetical protein
MDDFDLEDEPKSASPRDELAEAEAEFIKEMTRPLTTSDFPKMSQLQIDCINVQEKRVDISTFSPSYQQQIKDYYRFAPLNTESTNASATQAGREAWK